MGSHNASGHAKPVPVKEFFSSEDLEGLTGTPASTWRHWGSSGKYGPPSFVIGRRRVWKKSAVMAWLEAQESAASLAGNA
jgi:hypothetical protein